MMVGDCPNRGLILVDYADLLALVNVEPGLIVMYWNCLCGEKHLTATGSVGSNDPAKAAVALQAMQRLMGADGVDGPHEQRRHAKGSAETA